MDKKGIIPAREYAAKMLESFSENDFHSFFELGDAAVHVASEWLCQPLTDQQYTILLDALAEIRTDSSRRILVQLLLDGYSSRWSLAAQALYYNQPAFALEVLSGLLAQSSGRDKELKEKVLKNITE